MELNTFMKLMIIGMVAMIVLFITIGKDYDCEYYNKYGDINPYFLKKESVIAYCSLAPEERQAVDSSQKFKAFFVGSLCVFVIAFTINTLITMAEKAASTDAGTWSGSLLMRH
jgi:hypothetical protein